MREPTAKEIGLLQEWIPSARCAAVVTIMEIVDNCLGDSAPQEAVEETHSLVLQALHFLGVTDGELRDAAVAMTSPLRQLLVDMQ